MPEGRLYKNGTVDGCNTCVLLQRDTAITGHWCVRGQLNIFTRDSPAVRTHCRRVPPGWRPGAPERVCDAVIICIVYTFIMQMSSTPPRRNTRGSKMALGVQRDARPKKWAIAAQGGSSTPSAQCIRRTGIPTNAYDHGLIAL